MRPRAPGTSPFEKARARRPNFKAFPLVFTSIGSAGGLEGLRERDAERFCNLQAAQNFLEQPEVRRSILAEVWLFGA